MRLIAYARVSRVNGRSGESFISVGEQFKLCEHAVAVRPGAEIVERIEDLDESGGTLNRPGLVRALDLIDRDLVDGIVVAKLDRFTRTTAAIEVIERLEAGGKVFISATDNFDTSTSVGRFALAMMVLVARLERERNTEAWQLAEANFIGRGVHSSCPDGYVRENGPGSRLVLDGARAPLIREIFEMRAAGMSSSAILRHLEASGQRTKTGGAWTRSALWALFKCRAYMGDAYKGEHVNLDAHPAIVGREVWEAAQPSEGPPPPRVGGGLLSGLVRCEACGYVMKRRKDGWELKGGGRNERRRFCCGVTHTSGRCESPATASEHHIEPVVVEAFLERFGALAFEQADSGDAIVSATAAERDRLNEELRAMVVDVDLRGVLGDEAWREAIVARKQAAEAAERAHGDAVREQGASGMTVDASVWEIATPEERNALLRAGIDAVLVAPATSTRQPIAERMRIVWAGEMDWSTMPARAGRARRLPA